MLGFSVGPSLSLSDNYLATCAASAACEAKRSASRRESRISLRSDNFPYHAFAVNQIDLMLCRLWSVVLCKVVGACNQAAFAARR